MNFYNFLVVVEKKFVEDEDDMECIMVVVYCDLFENEDFEGEDEDGED